MTYLGYQVADLEDCSEEVEAWFQRHNGKSFRIWGKSVVGSGCNYGVDPEEYPWECDFMACFTDEGETCSFVTIDEQFSVTVAERPRDRWGNTATYAQGDATLVEGCFKLLYSDCSYQQCETEVRYLLEEVAKVEFEGEFDIDADDFVYWALENKPELVGTIAEHTVCNGTADGWDYYTTNRPLDSLEWKDAAKQYLATYE
jgi:hypothetical protein